MKLILKPMKGNFLFLVFIFFGQFCLLSQNTIQPKIFGQNVWYINVKNTPISLNHLDANLNDIVASGVTTVRIGGIDLNWYLDNLAGTSNNYVHLKTLVKKFKQLGISVIVQVGFNPVHPTDNISTQANKAAQIVTHLNTSSDPDHHVEFWIIANEPDGSFDSADPTAWGFGYDNSAGAIAIKNYIQAYSGAMKAATGGGTIKIIGPGLMDYYETKQVYLDLTDASKPATNILPFIDIFSFHFYPFGNQNKPQRNYDVPATRDNVIKFLTGIPSRATFANGSNTNPLRNVLAEVRIRLNNNGGSHIEIAITEANICHKNDVEGDNNITDNNFPTTDARHYPYRNTTPGADDEITGTGANSFIAGQFWAEMIAECMRANNPSGTNAKIKFLNFWSIKEGQSPYYEGNIGYLNNDPIKFGGTDIVPFTLDFLHRTLYIKLLPWNPISL
jgi:hypothetical protein